METLRKFLGGPWIWLVAAAILGLYGLYQYRPGSGPPEDPRPIGTAEDILALRERDDVNLLFILIDTLRAERLRAYGYTRPTSPTIDFVASQGVLFRRHLAQSSWTKCSMASMWTGLYPQRSGVTRFDDVIPDEAVMPAEILRDAGFRTVGMWRNGWVEGYFGFDQGFETYTRPNNFPLPPEVFRENPQTVNRGSDNDLMRSADEFLRVFGDERWFLYLHMMDVHEYTYDPESAKFGTAYSDIYDNSIHFVNRTLDQLFLMIYQRGYLDNTVIVIASDHGEAFGERGIEGHARTVYPETTEVPFVLGLPFRMQPGVVVEQRTANVDIWPTLLDLLGLPGLGDDVDGRSRVPEMVAAARGEVVADESPPAIAHLDTSWGQRSMSKSPTPMVGVAEKRFRYIAQHDGKGEVAQEELFDAEHDGGGELVNRLEDEPEVAERLRQVASQYMQGEPPWEIDPEKLELDELQLNQLRALGYQIP